MLVHKLQLESALFGCPQYVPREAVKWPHACTSPGILEPWNRTEYQQGRPTKDKTTSALTATILLNTFDRKRFAFCCCNNWQKGNMWFDVYSLCHLSSYILTHSQYLSHIFHKFLQITGNKRSDRKPSSLLCKCIISRVLQNDVCADLSGSYGAPPKHV